MLLIFTLFFGYSALQLKFDYDFEKFFPGEGHELAFFNEFRKTFETDNDFVLLALENEEGVFQEDFLIISRQFVSELEQMIHLRTIYSPINAEYPKVIPGSIVFKHSPYLNIDQPELYSKDSLFFADSKELMAGMLSIESNSICILLKHKQFITKKESDELRIALDELIGNYDFDKVHLVSKIHGQKVYVNIMQQEFLLFTSISIFILVIFLWFTYRSLWGILVPLVTVLIAVIGSSGTIQLSGKSLNMMTTLLPIIMLVVGMSDVVHFVSKYLEEIRLGKNKYEAVRLMLNKVGIATLFTSITTAIGFATLITIDMEPARDFGIYIAVGVLIAYLVTVLLIPSLFVFMRKPKIIDSKRLRNHWDRGLGKGFVWVLRKRKPILLLYVFLAFIAAFGIHRIRFDYFLMHDLSDDDPMMQELFYFQDHYGGIRPFEMALMPKGDYKVTDYKFLKEVNIIEDYLDSSYGVSHLTSPITPLKFINKLSRNGREEYYRFPLKESRYDYLMDLLEKQADSSLRFLIAPEAQMARISGRIKDPGSFAMLERNEALHAFIQQNIDTRIVDYEITGTPVIIDKSSRYLSRNVILGLLVAFGVIALLMGFLFRSIKMAFLSLVPNIFPIVLTAGCIGYLGIPLNMSTALIFTIAFGIAVDDTIHFLSRYKQEMNRGIQNFWAIRRTFLSTGKAIIITTIMLIGGFGSLILSDFKSTFYIGLFVSMTLIFAVITDLTLLPLLLLKKKSKKR